MSSSNAATAKVAAAAAAASSKSSATTPTNNNTMAGSKRKKQPLHNSSASSASTAAAVKRVAQVDTKVIEEILLVGSVMATQDPNTGELVPVQECLQWLQDLQRVIRRDDDNERPITLVIGQWKLLQQKLLPLCLYSGRYDRPLLQTLCKILIMLTKPVTDHTLRAGRMVIPSKAESERDQRIIQEQIWLRENAIQQTNLLVEYKKAFCHVHTHQQQSKAGGGRGLFSVLVSMLAEPLGKPGRRTDEDHLTIELVLHLFSNLLKAQPLFVASSLSNDDAAAVHDELVYWMEQELVLDILCVLSADLEHRDNAPYNLLLLELLHHLWKPYHPAAVARAVSGSNNNNNNTATNKTRATTTPQGPSLLGQLKRERQSYAVQAHTRHGHFGGTLQIQKKNQQKGVVQYVSSAQFAASARGGASSSTLNNNSSSSNAVHNATTLTQRHHKRANVFLPSGGHAAHRRQGPSAQRAQRILHQFLQRFCHECYGPVAKSLKGEFRRDAVQLQEGDQVLFLRFVWFVSHWWRLSKQPKSSQTNMTCIGPLVFTMDVFTFDMVLRSMESFQQLKQYQNLGPTVAVFSEMMHLLNTLYQSKEPTEHVMALGLLDRLFYNAEPLDRLPQLLSKWEPGTTTREYVADLVEVVHSTCKILEANEAVVREANDNGKQDKKKNKKVDATVAQMREAARDFDVNTYIRRRLVSVHTVFLYIQLLGQFEHNSTTTNHRVVAFLKNRLCKQIVSEPDHDEDHFDGMATDLPVYTVTLQPLLYQFSLLRILDQILNSRDTLPADQKKILVPWATSLVYDFSIAAKRNPLLWVEALLAPSHLVARHSEQVTNTYVSEEIRMLLVKDQLQKRIARQAQEEEEEQEGQHEEDDGDDEEVEFDDTLPVYEPKVTRSKSGSKRKVLEDSDDDNDSEDDTLSKPTETAASKRQKRIEDDDDEDDDDDDDNENTALEDKNDDSGTDIPPTNQDGTEKEEAPENRQEQEQLPEEMTDDQPSETTPKLQAPENSQEQELPEEMTDDRPSETTPKLQAPEDSQEQDPPEETTEDAPSGASARRVSTSPSNKHSEIHEEEEEESEEEAELETQPPNSH